MLSFERFVIPSYSGSKIILPSVSEIPFFPLNSIKNKESDIIALGT